MIELLRRMHDEDDVSFDRICVLSPFRDVVNQADRNIRDKFGADAFPEKQIGTVHTMQGRETDVVVLVLGTDPSPSKRARDWAARPPNLLNVAVSRARRRLFIIGSLAEWGEIQNFSEAARVLPTVKFETGARTE
jgi:superfamily I DNA and/or RNA helicase